MLLMFHTLTVRSMEEVITCEHVQNMVTVEQNHNCDCVSLYEYSQSSSFQWWVARAQWSCQSEHPAPSPAPWRPGSTHTSSSCRNELHHHQSSRGIRTMASNFWLSHRKL
jgi:hypothetical protein